MVGFGGGGELLGVFGSGCDGGGVGQRLVRPGAADDVARVKARGVEAGGAGLLEGDEAGDAWVEVSGWWAGMDGQKQRQIGRLGLVLE